MDIGLLNQALALKAASSTGGKENGSVVGSGFAEPFPPKPQRTNRKETAVKSSLFVSSSPADLVTGVVCTPP